MAAPLVITQLGGWLLSGAAANNVSGTALDCRRAIDFAIFEHKCTGNSAISDLLYSLDGTDWATALSVTATNGSTAFLQVSAFYPYVNFSTRLVYSAAGGSARVYGAYVPGMSI